MLLPNPGAGDLSAQSVSVTIDSSGEPGFFEKLRQVLRKGKSPDPNASVTDKYSGYYDWIHQEEIQLYDSLSKMGVTDWDRYQNIITHQVVLTDSAKQVRLAPNVKVFGWHPYWMGNAYKSYKFNLLSYVAWFSYDIDPPTGNYKNPDVIAAWLASDTLVEMAHSGGCKVLLTITNHSDAKGHHAFLDNPDCWRTLTANLLKLLKEGNGDGVDVNFENIPDDLEDEMTAFLTMLSRALRQANPEYLLTVDLPIYDYNNTYQFKKLDEVVNLFLVTGYDYYNGRSRTDGPVAPLDGPTKFYTIKNSVNKYLNAGLKPEKLLLGLPYYGTLWTARSPTPGAFDTTLVFRQHMTYRAVQARFCTAKSGFDPISWSAYYMVHNPDSNYYEKCWFDDSLSLSRKYDWVLEHKLGGIGIWALGYDNGYPQLWELLEKKFASDTFLTYQGAYMEHKYYNLPRSLSAYRVLVAVAGIFLAVFVLAGLVIALFDWRVREVFFMNRTLRLLYTTGAAGILLCVYAFYLFVTGQPVVSNEHFPTLTAGLVLGIGLAMTVGYFFEKHRQSLP